MATSATINKASPQGILYHLGAAAREAFGVVNSALRRASAFLSKQVAQLAGRCVAAAKGVGRRGVKVAKSGARASGSLFKRVWRGTVTRARTFLVEKVARFTTWRAARKLANQITGKARGGGGLNPVNGAKVVKDALEMAGKLNAAGKAKE